MNIFDELMKRCTPNEQRFLTALLTNVGHFVPKQTLSMKVWGDDIGRESGLRVLASNVNGKIRLSEIAAKIKYRHGKGYGLFVL